ncbi:hypothetical protein [Micromonospora sp. C81]|uniref:hypothetical protein n=1 Tax=Micromonospora sp. C81 TaxID=2824881 RepID=UPI001B39A48D|nr:hypothetical protein [Micromonospora sp. C81]MBQ1039130.1 hypothetical protein [Micromonospora sp. C81]
MTEHEVLPGAAVTALAATAAGDLVVAGNDGMLLLLSGGRIGTDEAPRAAVTEFLAATSEASVVDMDQLDLTDGTRTWQPGDLEVVSEDSGTDPSWLRIRAAMNRLT